MTAIADDLNDEFCNHPKTEWVSGVPIYTQIKSININLLGLLLVVVVLIIQTDKKKNTKFIKTGALYVAQMIAESSREGKRPTTPGVNRARFVVFIVIVIVIVVVIFLFFCPITFNNSNNNLPFPSFSPPSADIS